MYTEKCTYEITGLFHTHVSICCCSLTHIHSHIPHHYSPTPHHSPHPHPPTPTATDPAAARNLAIIEGQLAWLVHIVGAVIRGRLSSGSADSQEPLDGDLAARVFGLLQVMDAGAGSAQYESKGREHLEVAVLTFFQNFRKVYVGEQVMHSSKVGRRGGESECGGCCEWGEWDDGGAPVLVGVLRSCGIVC